MKRQDILNSLSLMTTAESNRIGIDNTFNPTQSETEVRPTQAFWALWRTDKDAVKAAGFRVDKDDDYDEYFVTILPEPEVEPEVEVEPDPSVDFDICEFINALECRFTNNDISTDIEVLEPHKEMLEEMGFKFSTYFTKPGVRLPAYLTVRFGEVRVK